MHSEPPHPSSPERASLHGRIVGGRIEIDGRTPWPDGTHVEVRELIAPRRVPSKTGHAIIAGFGLAGRCVAELLTLEQIPFTIVERNPKTVATQESLGKSIVFGDITTKETLIQARLPEADVLSLTIPDEDAVLRATTLARQLNPGIYIIARTNYASKGLEASSLGADDVVKAEQAVAMQFRHLISRRLRHAESLEAGTERT